MNYSETLVIKLNAIAHHFKEVTRKAVTDVLHQSKNTGAGVASVTVSVVDGDSNKAPKIVISFDDHLIYLDKRKIQWTKLPDMKNLLAWAETKKSSPTEARKLAWAVAWDKKKHDTWKAKLWRKKSLSAVLKEMNQLVLKEFDMAIDNDFQQAANVK